MEARVTSILDDPIAQLLLNGEAENPSAAERLYLERHLDEVFASPSCHSTRPRWPETVSDPRHP